MLNLAPFVAPPKEPYLNDEQSFVKQFPHLKWSDLVPVKSNLYDGISRYIHSPTGYRYERGNGGRNDNHDWHYCR
jgi:hypothetical protein